MADESVIGFVLSRSRARRGLIPVLVPAGLLLLSPGIVNGLDNFRDQLLAQVGRRTSYLRRAMGVQITGVVVAWIGLALPYGRTVTIVGICVTLAGMLLSLTGADRLHSIESKIEELWGRYREGLLEFALLRLAISPYSYTETSASGRSVHEIMESRRRLLKDEVIRALLPCANSYSGADFDNTEWIVARARGLNELDCEARRQAVGVGRRFDAAYAILLALILLVAILSATKVVPEAALATAALVIVLVGRPGHLATAPLIAAGQGEQIGAWIDRRERVLQADGPTAEDLASLVTAEVAIARQVIGIFSRSVTVAGG
jgi:hypothetical protein